MKLRLLSATLFLVWLLTPKASAASPPTLAVPLGLSFAEIQITGDEFIVLQNNSGSAIPELSTYWLYYFNKTDPQAAGTKLSFIQLPSGKLDNGQTVLLSTVGRAACGAAIADNLSTSLVDSGGFLELVRFSVSSNGTINQIVGDSLSWSSGTTGMIQKVASATPQPVYYRYQASSLPTYAWQKAASDTVDQCKLVVSSGSTSPPAIVNAASLQQAKSSPPSTILFLEPEAGGQAIPANDNGLAAPQLSEVLPNPKSPQTDADDEFIELYNPNDKSFDLSGFKLVAGTTTAHEFTFGQGTLLKPKSFTFFLSATTHLTLTNSNGQVKLQDPLGRNVSQTDIYDSAKDGQSWSIASGHWYWTGRPTPGTANVVDQSSGTGGPTPAGKISGAAGKDSAAAPTSTGYSTAAYPSNPSPNANTPKSGSSPLHPTILAVIGGLALLYGLYEYRHDLANQVEKLRRYRRSRRAASEVIEGAGGAGATKRFGRRQNHLRAWFSQRLRRQRAGEQSELHAQPRVSSTVWYEALPFRLLPTKRIRRSGRPVGRSRK